MDAGEVFDIEFMPNLDIPPDIGLQIGIFSNRTPEVWREMNEAREVFGRDRLFYVRVGMLIEKTTMGSEPLVEVILETEIHL